MTRLYVPECVQGVKAAADEVERNLEEDQHGISHHHHHHLEAGLGWIMYAYRAGAPEIVEELRKRHPNTTFELQTVPKGYEYVKVTLPSVQ
jgi:hypothetical protein